MILTIDELVLRPWRPADAPEVLAVCQDPEIARWVTIPQPYLAADAEAFIETAKTVSRGGTGAPFAIVDPATDRLLGAVIRFGPDVTRRRSARRAGSAVVRSLLNRITA
jgi:RimJ/RimL family protein N-acetyltransferase